MSSRLQERSKNIKQNLEKGLNTLVQKPPKFSKKPYLQECEDEESEEEERDFLSIRVKELHRKRMEKLRKPAFNDKKKPPRDQINFKGVEYDTERLETLPLNRTEHFDDITSSESSDHIRTPPLLKHPDLFKGGEYSISAIQKREESVVSMEEPRLEYGIPKKTNKPIALDFDAQPAFDDFTYKELEEIKNQIDSRIKSIGTGKPRVETATTHTAENEDDIYIAINNNGDFYDDGLLDMLDEIEEERRAIEHRENDYNNEELSNFLLSAEQGSLYEYTNNNSNY